MNLQCRAKEKSLGAALQTVGTVTLAVPGGAVLAGAVPSSVVQWKDHTWVLDRICILGFRYVKTLSH